MNYCAIQRNTCSNLDDYRSSGAALVCPKPRRLGILNPAVNDHHSVRSLRWQLSHQVEICDSKAGSDVMDIILTKGGGHGFEHSSSTQVISSPPYFSGSPPSRLANPLIQDARFRDPISALSPVAPPSNLSSPPSRNGGGSFIRGNFGNKPAMRVEGFDCLDRDRRNCSISALA